MPEQLVFSLDKLLRWIMKLFLLHVYMVVFSLAGLFLFGTFPAMVASLSISKRWLNYEEFSLGKEFRKVYGKEFLRANLLGWLLTIIAFVLYLNYNVMLQMGDQLSVVVVFAYYFVVFVFLTIVAWIFPLYIHSKERLLILVKDAFIMGITFLPRTLAIWMVVFIIMYISLSVPTMLLFFTGSLITLCLMFITQGVFQKLTVQEGLAREE